MTGEDELRWSEKNKQYFLISKIKEIVSLPLEQDENKFINRNIHDLEALLGEEEEEKIVD